MASRLPHATISELKAQRADVSAIGSTPDDPYSLIYLTLISAIGNAERQIEFDQCLFRS